VIVTVHDIRRSSVARPRDRERCNILSLSLSIGRCSDLPCSSRGPEFASSIRVSHREEELPFLSAVLFLL